MQQKTLPAETIQEIFRHHYEANADNKTELTKLTLVNKFFREMGQRYVFRHVKVAIGSSALEGLYAFLSKAEEIRAYVQELSITQLDDTDISIETWKHDQALEGSIRNSTKIAHKLLVILSSSPITKLSLVASGMNSPPFGPGTTPDLQDIFNKALKIFSGLTWIRVCGGEALDTTALQYTPRVHTLELQSTNLYPELPYLASDCPAGHTPLRLNRLVLTIGELEEIPDYHGNWDSNVEIHRFLELTSLRYLEVTINSDNGWVGLLNVCLPASASTLETLVLQVWNHEGIYATPLTMEQILSLIIELELLEGLKECRALKNLKLCFVNCTSQFTTGSLEDLEWEDEEDDEDFSALDTFTHLKPPESLEHLSLMFQWEWELEEPLSRWAKRALPELDGVIANDRETLWRNLQSVEFEMLALGNDNPGRFHLGSTHMKRTQTLGIEVNVVSAKANDETPCISGDENQQSEDDEEESSRDDQDEEDLDPETDSDLDGYERRSDDSEY